MSVLDPRASDLWWTLLVGRLSELRAALPTTLVGTIQLCSPSGPGRDAHFHWLRLAGPATVAHEGWVDEPDLWIELDEAKIATWLETGDVQEGALRSSGKHELWRTLFECMQSKGQSKSWLQIRGMR